MILKKGIEVDQYYTVFNYGHPIPQKEIKSQDRKIVAGPGMKSATKLVLPGNRKEKFGKETSPDEFIRDNVESQLDTAVDKARGNVSGAIVKRFIKPRASTMFG